VFQSAIWDMDSCGQAVIQQLDAQGGATSSSCLPYEPVYYIALCAASAEMLPDVADRLWLFADSSESVYQHYYHEIRKNMAAGGVLEEFQAEISNLKAQLEALGGESPRGWISRLLQRLINGHG